MEVDPDFTDLPRSPRPIDSSATRAMPSTRSGSTSRSLDQHGLYTCTHLLQVRRRLPEGRQPDRARSCRLRLHRGLETSTSRTGTTATATSTRSSKNIRRNGLLHEADLLPDSYGGKFHPRAVPELLASLPVAVRGMLRGKITPAKALRHPHKASKELRDIFDRIESKPERYELNLYVSGTDEDNAVSGASAETPS